MAYPEGPELVRAVMAQLGITRNVDLARELALDMNGPSRISKWLAGKSSPDYEATMKMLDACGWLNIAEDARGEAVQPRDRLAGLEAKVEAQGASMTLALKGLTAGIRKLERQLAAEAPAASQKAAR